MDGYFDWKSFCNYYLNKSKYASKDNLLHAFYDLWYKETSYRGINYVPGFTYHWKEWWKADTKKRFKTQLLGWNYTSAGIDGIFKAFTEWNKNAPK